MESSILLLCGTAASIGFLHTALGPDHYIPFIAMGKARQWSKSRLALITVLCGLAHVLSSIVLGLFGIWAGSAIASLTNIESIRGELAAWALIAFGFLYFLWGLKNHHHEHKNEGDVTPWILFIVFALGPCEPLIPVLMYPAATEGMWAAALVATVFCVVTLVTMTTIVMLVSSGFSLIPLKKFERYSHAIAGATICCSGLAVQFLGL